MAEGRFETFIFYLQSALQASWTAEFGSGGTWRDPGLIDSLLISRSCGWRGSGGTMAILGINGTTSCLWLAVVSDAGDVIEAPHSLTPASDTPLDEQIGIAVDDATRLFDRFGIDAVVVLDAETVDAL